MWVVRVVLCWSSLCYGPAPGTSARGLVLVCVLSADLEQKVNLELKLTMPHLPLHTSWVPNKMNKLLKQFIRSLMTGAQERSKLRRAAMLGEHCGEVAS